MTDSAPRPRLVSVDALRGLAAILMVQQHLGVWMVNPHAYGSTLRTIFAGINMTGGAAAPLFITLAGTAAALAERGNRPPATYLRGVMLLLLGFLLNLMVPSWFGTWSFYVLHLLGVWLLVAPGVLRLNTLALPHLAAGVLLITVLGQTFADTPLAFTNEMMRTSRQPGGPLRLALLESQFPIFPWLALAIGGAWAGRALNAGRSQHLLVGAAICASLAALLRSLVFVIPRATSELPWRAICRTGRTFFPMSTVYALSLFALCLLLLWFFTYLETKSELKADSWLVPLGRSSLTLLIVHIVLFREGLTFLDARQRLHPALAVMLIITFLATWVWMARLWSRVDYRYGFEWLLRRLEKR